jgi:maltokinase
MMSLGDELPDLLLSWLPRQRWFAAKDREISRISIDASATLLTGDPGADLTILAVEYAGGEDPELYQLLIARRHGFSNDLRDGVIGIVGDSVVYDGLRDSTISEWLLKTVAQGGSHGDVRIIREPGAQIPQARAGHVSSESSGQISITYGSECILKWFRQALPGNSTDLELRRALRRAGSEHIARPLAAIEKVSNDSTLTIAILQDFIPNPAEAWAMALVSVRDLLAERDLRPSEVGGDFAAESFRLGVAVAEVHADLAWALGTGEQESSDVADAMSARLSEVQKTMPELLPYGDRIRAAYDLFADLNTIQVTQRIHGNLHLHNILRTPNGWLLVDFGGGGLTESLDDATRPDSVLRDVADVLHSLDNAAHSQLLDWGQTSQLDRQLLRRASEWSSRNRSAFWDGYTSYAQIDPRQRTLALHVYELDRVVSESGSHTRIRPEAVEAILNSIEQMNSDGEYEG